MFNKIKDNIGLIVTGIALLSSVGAGVSAVGEIVTTLTNIDERMEYVEIEFNQLREDTMVSSDIAVLFSRLQALEDDAMRFQNLDQDLGYINGKLQALEQESNDLDWKIQDLENRIFNDNFSDTQELDIQKWEWNELVKKANANEIKIQTVKEELWQLEDNRTRINYLEANNHNH
jgi:tetrahydromethanopterin S-methyltransferase subunit G|tara:strand:+ start:210 stop:734 length:525 start_codon:yes stop_codon:yes gene_type:complete